MNHEFYFSEGDFKLQIPCLNAAINGLQLTQFDKELQATWKDHMEKGHFQYQFNGYSTDEIRVLKGKYGFVTQLNPNRASKRRPPQAMLHLKQDFNHNKFNFTKIPEEDEVIFVLKKLEDTRSSGKGRDMVVINTSPLEFGACLLLPSVESCLPQVLTLDSIRLAIQTVLLSGVKNFKAAFNSLCAFASVNHLHWHLYYLQNHSLYLESCPAKRLAGDCYELTPDDYSAPCFAFQVSSSSSSCLQRAAESVFRVTDYLTQQDIGHNVVVTRGASFDRANDDLANEAKSINSLRIFVWARDKNIGAKKPGDFIMAACELSGQTLIYEKASFETIVEDTITAAQLKACKTVYENVRPKIKDLFKK